MRYNLNKNSDIKKSDNIEHWALGSLEDKMGCKLQGERSTDFFFYFPEEHQAHHVAAALTNLQFDTKVSYFDYGHNWLCLATKNVNISSGRLWKLREWMEQLADRHGGKYDGWETMVDLNNED